MNKVFLLPIFLLSLFCCDTFSYDNPNDIENIDFSEPEISASKGRSKMILVEWQAKQEQIRSYVLYRGEKRSALSEIARISGEQTCFEDNDPALLPGILYYYAVAVEPAEGVLSERSASAAGYISFDTPGVVVNRNSGPQATDEIPSKIAVDDQGNMFVSGGISYPGNLGEIVIWKFTPQGLPDTSFNGTGFVSFSGPPYNQGAFAYSLAVDRAGKIVVTGWVCTGNDSETFDMILLRYNPDGSLDRSFNEKGFLVSEIPGKDSGVDLSLTRDGKIVVAGYMSNGTDPDMALWRFNEDGTRDLSFNAAGYVTHHNAAGGNGEDRAQALAIDSQNRLIVTGNSLSAQGDTNDVVVWRYTPAGELDTGFNGTGYQILAFSSGETPLHDNVHDLAVDSSDTIIFSGYTRYKNGSSLGGKLIFVSRIKTNGSFDLSFNNGAGFFFFQTETGHSGMLYSLFVDTNDTIYGAGNIDYSGNSDTLIFKLLPGGTLDSSFNGCGYVSTHNVAGGESHDRIRDIVLDKNGTIIGAGFSLNDTDEDMFLVKYDSNMTAAQ